MVAKNDRELFLAEVNRPKKGCIVANKGREVVLAYAGDEFAKLRPVSLCQRDRRFFVSSTKRDAGADRGEPTKEPRSRSWPAGPRKA